MKQYVLMSNEELDGLQHFGVRGMKWGVRKAYSSTKKRVTGSKAYKGAKKYGRKGISASKKYGRKGLRTVNAKKNKIVKKWNNLSPAKKKLIVGTASTALVLAAAYAGSKGHLSSGLEKAFNSNETFIEKNMRSGIAEFNRSLRR